MFGGQPEAGAGAGGRWRLDRGRGGEGRGCSWVGWLNREFEHGLKRFSCHSVHLPVPAPRRPWVACAPVFPGARAGAPRPPRAARERPPRLTAGLRGRGRFSPSREPRAPDVRKKSNDRTNNELDCTQIRATFQGGFARAPCAPVNAAPAARAPCRAPRPPFLSAGCCLSPCRSMSFLSRASSSASLRLVRVRVIRIRVRV